MKKIPTIFVRDESNRSIVTDVVTPGCEWVLAGHGVPTIKLDGTCCLVRDGKLYKRHEVKPDKPSPEGFILEDHDPITGKSFGWLAVGDGPEDKWHREAWIRRGFRDIPIVDWTYELCGPKVNGNPEGLSHHCLVPHAQQSAEHVRTFEWIKAFVSKRDIEGLVYWRDPSDPNCDKAKIKKKDFGLPRKP
jgi:hypothetical protein